MRESARSARRSSIRPLFRAVETLEPRQLFSIVLGTPAATPLSAVPVGDPAAPVIADFNGDSNLDVIVAFPSSSAIDPGFIQFGAGDGAGTFLLSTEVNVGIFTGRPVAADFDGDQILDLAFTNAFNGQTLVMKGAGNGTFASAVSFSAGTSPEPLDAGDLNGDGRADLVVGNRSDNTLQIYLGDATNLLTAGQTLPTGAGPASLAVADFNGDSFLDVLVGAAGVTGATTGTLQLFTGDGSGTLNTTPIETAGPLGLTDVGDLNGDALPDVVVGVTNNDTADVLLNDGDGTFTLTPGSTGVGGTKVAVIADLDDNNRPDIVSAVGGQIDVLPGAGGGAFGAPLVFQSAGGSGPAVADVNADGRPDVLTIAGTPGVQAGRTLNVSLGQRIGPDLTIEWITQPPQSVLIPSIQKASFRVTNNGNEPVKDNVLLQIMASTDPVVDENDSLAFQTAPKLNLKPGKSKVVKVKFEVNLSPGTYNLIARIDPFSTTGDLNLFDNEVLAPQTLTTAEAFVDLVGQMQPLASTQATIGKPFRFEVLVTNLGNITVSSRVGFSFGASSDTTLDVSDQVLVEPIKRVKLLPGQAKVLKFTARPAVIPGSYFIVGVVNAGGAVFEADIDNNGVVSAEQVAFAV